MNAWLSCAWWLLTAVATATAASLALPGELRTPLRVGRDADSREVQQRYSEAEWKSMRDGEVLIKEAPKPTNTTTDEHRVQAAEVSSSLARRGVITKTTW